MENIVSNLRKFLMLSLLLIISLTLVNASEIYVGDSNSLSTIPNDVFTKLIIVKEFTTLDDDTSNFIQDRSIIDTPQETLFTIQVLNDLGTDKTFLLSATYFVAGEPVFVTETFNLSLNSQQVFGVMTTQKNEEFEIFIQCTSGCGDSDNITDSYKVVSQILIKEETTLNSVMNSFVNATKQLVDINLGIWKLFYYLVIISLVFVGIGLIISFGFKIYEWAEILSEKKHEIIHKEPKHRR